MLLYISFTMLTIRHAISSPFNKNSQNSLLVCSLEMTYSELDSQ